MYKENDNEWKCKDCVCYDTDACHFPSQSEEYKACEHLVVDHNYAYQKGRADATNEWIDIIDKGLPSFKEKLLSRLKEQNND